MKKTHLLLFNKKLRPILLDAVVGTDLPDELYQYTLLQRWPKWTNIHFFVIKFNATLLQFIFNGYFAAWRRHEVNWYWVNVKLRFFWTWRKWEFRNRWQLYNWKMVGTIIVSTSFAAYLGFVDKSHKQLLLQFKTSENFEVI